MTDIATITTRNGVSLTGEPLGARAEVNGPLKVCTAAASPLAELRKPEYDGAIVVFTTPHIAGSAADLNGAVAAGVIVREPAAGLDALLRDAGLAGVAGVDTRELTQLAVGAAGAPPARITQYPGQAAQ